MSALAFLMVIGCARAPSRPTEAPTPDAEAPPDALSGAEPAAESPLPDEPAATPPAAGAPSPAAPGPKKRLRRNVPPGGAPPGRATAAYTGPDPCQLAIRGDSPVGRACHQGGVKAAKVVMKDLVRRAKAGGVKFNCDDCHASQEDFGDLAGDAREKFEKLLAAAGL
jgi:hypothetical protein